MTELETRAIDKLIDIGNGGPARLVSEEARALLEMITASSPPNTTRVHNDCLEKMQAQVRVLEALRAGGVDNWDWYESSLDDAGIDALGMSLEAEKPEGYKLG